MANDVWKLFDPAEARPYPGMKGARILATASITMETGMTAQNVGHAAEYFRPYFAIVADAVQERTGLTPEVLHFVIDRYEQTASGNLLLLKFSVVAFLSTGIPTSEALAASLLTRLKERALCPECLDAGGDDNEPCPRCGWKAEHIAYRIGYRRLPLP